MMKPEYIQLIQDTVPVLRKNGVSLTQYFYTRMLNNHPELKNTFNLDHQSTGRQPRALAAAVLAYAENIENPSVLTKALERITTKHVSLNIQPEHYMIVGDNLLHSISEVLNVTMDSDLIAAWKAAYLQLAALMIDLEKNKYTTQNTQTGGWSGWRDFKITTIEAMPEGQIFTLIANDAQTIPSAEVGEFISVRIHLKDHDLHQPQQFTFTAPQHNERYQIIVKQEESSSTFSVANTLLTKYQVNDIVEVSQPAKL